MKIWVDDIRPAPVGYVWCKSVYAAIDFIKGCNGPIELIDIDHDAGDYAGLGGDYINVLNWLEETERNYPIRLHTVDLGAAENMRRIIEKNRWREVR